MNRIILSIVFLMAIGGQAMAEPLNEAAKLWSKLGGKSVATGAEIYKTQRAGHVTLGSIYLSNQKKNRQLYNVTFPEIKIPGTCTGSAVMSFGGVSFISGPELKEKVTSVISNAGLTLIYLGISAVTPTLSETVQEVFSKIQEQGGFLSDECQLSESIMSFAKDKFAQYNAAKKKQVSDDELSDGTKADLASVYKKFPKGSGARAENIAKKNPEKRLANINLAWDSLKKLGLNNKTKSLMMTLSGTVIIHENKKDKDGEPSVQYIAPKITDLKLLEGLLVGDTEFEELVCVDKGENKEKCLELKATKRKVSKEESFEYIVSQHFNNFKKSLEDDAELDSGSINFLAKSGLPVYMIYEVLYTKSGGHPEAESGSLIKITAWNILFQYLTELINDSIEAGNNLKIGASQELSDYRKSLLKARDMLNQHEIQDSNRNKLQQMIVDRAVYQQKELEQQQLATFGLGK